MVIGIDASQANKKERTGTEWYAFYILREWILTNAFSEHEVWLYIQMPLCDDLPALPKNWHVHILKWPPKIFWSQVRLSWEFLFSRIDLLFVPAHTIPLIHPRKTVTIVHDIGFETNPELYSKKSVVQINSWIIQILISFFVRIFTLGKYGANELNYQRFGLRFAIAHTTLIFTVSQFTKNEIRKKFDKHPSLVVAYNGILHKEFYHPFSKKLTALVKEKYSLQKPYILSVGRIEKKKNSLELAKIFKQLTEQEVDSNLELVYVGGEGFESDQVHNYVSAHKLEHRVRFLGWVPQKDLAPLLSGASLFAFFSAYEGFGVPLLQALAVGAPVVASNLEVFREIADNCATYCDPHETKETSVICQKILENAQRETVSKCAELTHRFTWEITANIIKKNLESILAKN